MSFGDLVLKPEEELEQAELFRLQDEQQEEEGKKRKKEDINAYKPDRTVHNPQNCKIIGREVMFQRTDPKIPRVIFFFPDV